jgi:hypothetical protein
MLGLFKKDEVGRETARLTWPAILSNAEASRETYREAVAALNVKLIRELAPLVRDPSKYESFRHEAADLALSIRDERYRTFAMKQVEGLSRRAAELSWPRMGRDGTRTQLTKKPVDQNPRDLMREGSKTPLILSISQVPLADTALVSGANSRR